MTTSAQLERQSERQRAQFTETLDELRSRMTPGQVVDQLTDYVREGSGGTFFRNFREQCMANPVPTTLIGAGLAWFMLSSWRPAPRRPVKMQGAPRDFTAYASDPARGGKRFASKGDDAYGPASQYPRRTKQANENLADEAGEYREGMWRSAEDFRNSRNEAATGAQEDFSRSPRDLPDSVRDAAAAGYEKVAAGYDTIADTASSVYETTASQARGAAESIGDAASQARGTVGRATEKVTTILRDQPLVLAGLGLAVGALLGAVLPTTEAEDKVIGPSSDELKEKVSGVASETLEKGKVVAEHAWQEAREEAENQGLLPLNKAVNDAIDKVAEGEKISEPSLVPDPDDGRERVPGGA